VDQNIFKRQAFELEVKILCAA